MKSMTFAVLKGRVAAFLPGLVCSGSALSRGERLLNHLYLFLPMKSVTLITKY